MCCLKRPFDDQSQSRIRLETEAVLNLLSLEPEKARFVRSAALLLENQFNPVRERAARVEAWLRAGPIYSPGRPEELRIRVEALRRLGLKSFDALHVASAEQAGADLFVTVDDRLLAAANRGLGLRVTRCVSILSCAQELTT
jgi:predicted nucleic acid-binding protein